MRQLYEQGRADSQTEVYLVVFRSRLLAGADIHKLLKDDEAAHFEASQAPGYITYFKGAADTDGNNLSFCLWQSQNSAREAAFGEKHKLAAGNVSEAYAYFSLQRYFVSQAQDGDVVFIPA
ncbi:MAG TPA: hypothetical protein VGA08_02790 [Candidatus Saccharimonadales bacterium]